MHKHIGKELKELLNLLKRNMEKNTKIKDISPGQVRILNYIIVNSDKNIIQRDIEEEFNIRRSSATELIQKLEKKELLYRVEDENDKRIKILKVTEKGIELESNIYKYICICEQKISQGLTEDEINFFFSITEKMKRNLEEEGLEG